MEALRLCDLCTEYEHKTKDVQGQGPSNINLILFVCFFDVFWHSLSFPSISYGFSKELQFEDKALWNL